MSTRQVLTPSLSAGIVKGIELAHRGKWEEGAQAYVRREQGPSPS